MIDTVEPKTMAAPIEAPVVEPEIEMKAENPESNEAEPALN